MIILYFPDTKELSGYAGIYMQVYSATQVNCVADQDDGEEGSFCFPVYEYDLMDGPQFYYENTGGP